MSITPPRPTVADSLRHAMEEGASMAVDLQVALPGQMSSSTLRLVSTHHYDQVADAMRSLAEVLAPLPVRPPLPMALEVPPYAYTLVERLEEVRATLEARNLVPVRRAALEAEAANLGAALGSMLARVLLEQRSAD